MLEIFGNAVAELLNRAGLISSYEVDRPYDGTLRVGNAEFSLRQRGRTMVSIDGRITFRQSNIEQTAAYLVTRLPAAITAQEQQEKAARVERFAQSCSMGGRRRHSSGNYGYEVDGPDLHIGAGTLNAEAIVTFRTSDWNEARQVLMLILMLRRRKGNGDPVEKEALMNAILDMPEEDTHSLVFADWLDENELPDLATRIRERITSGRASTD